MKEINNKFIASASNNKDDSLSTIKNYEDEIERSDITLKLNDKYIER